MASNMASNENKGDALANIPADIVVRFILPCVPLRGVAAWAATGHHWAATFGFGPDGTPLSPEQDCAVWGQRYELIARAGRVPTYWRGRRHMWTWEGECRLMASLVRWRTPRATCIAWPTPRRPPPPRPEPKQRIHYVDESAPDPFAGGSLAMMGLLGGGGGMQARWPNRDFMSIANGRGRIARMRLYFADFVHATREGDDDGEMAVMWTSSLWNLTNRMQCAAHGAYLHETGLSACCVELLRLALEDKDWLDRGQNYFVPYYATARRDSAEHFFRSSGAAVHSYGPDPHSC